jgi:hypothetical protein
MFFMYLLEVALFVLRRILLRLARSFHNEQDAQAFNLIKIHSGCCQSCRRVSLLIFPVRAALERQAIVSRRNFC